MSEVTELIARTCETYLKKTTAYAVDPASVLYALQGQAFHSTNELNTQGEIITERRLKNEITSGQFDLYGKILNDDESVLGDLKVTSYFKLMRALGIYKEKIPTGEIYKLGLKKGQPKFRTELRYYGVRDILEILNCDLVTCTEIEVNGQLFDVYSDDEALIKPNPMPNLYLDDNLIIFGSIAFAKADEEGKLIGLYVAEIQLLWKFYLEQFAKLLKFIRTQGR